MRSLLIVSALLVLSAGAAAAQPGYEGGPRPRVGLELGFGLQAGEISCESEDNFCDDFTEAGGLNLNASYFLAPSFGIALDLWAMAHAEDDFTFAHYVNTIGVKWRPVPILTLSAGIGSAHATVDYNGLIDARYTSADAFAVMGAASLDLIRGRRFAFFVEARVGHGFYGDDNDNGTADIVGRNAGVGLGLSFIRF
ncbi:MAG TPA: hypothetical protein VNO30_13775 [Kofleriaceae bacterium]|nr:hypothetical protein [Kofleriaceae bacterium]